MNAQIELNRDVARKVLETVDHGLCSGLGRPKPGEMCVEAAVCYALGLPHDDKPGCVGHAVRRFKISLNDCRWSSNAARAKGMRKLAIAQLGSHAIDQKEFATRLAIKTVQRIVPIALRAAAEHAQEPHKQQLLDAASTPYGSVKFYNGTEPHKQQLLDAATVCEQVTNRESAHAAAEKARAVARAAYAADAADAYAADAYAAYAASAASASADAADAAAAAAYYADAASASSASADAAAAAYAAAAYAAYYAAYYADAYSAADAYAAAKRDEVLTVSADCALEALIELKSPGCEWLDLCELPAAA